ncbi:DUF805 domain-containing protein [Lactococcus cremoris]|nr:DUF805 domain-containing protein [Lactococcus cremoris]MCT4400265.1 DUF805 domain-containing protein [Lactococcus cremoris]MCT4429596.1 DUF805 domain-containing protein [Lactococcus cremoris]UXV64315.1 DUF805 domain-containing protein [Lactococcus cremoris]
MIQVYIEYWKQYFNWSGRTTRKSFWWVFIMNLAIALTLILLYIVTTGAAVVLSFDFEGFNVATYIFGSLLILWSLATLIPTSNLGIRRVRDTGLSPWIWLLSPVSSILGGFNNFPAEIVSDILFLAFLGLALMPSKKGRISSRSQSQGSLIIAIGLIALVGFSVVNLPAKAEHIVQGLPQTNLVIKTNSDAKISLSGLTSESKQEVISAYKENGWKLSESGENLIKQIYSANQQFVIDNQTYQTDVNGKVIAKVTSNIVTNITASDSASAPTIRSNIDGKNSDSVKIRTPFAKTKTVIVNQTIDVNEVVNQMDMVNGNSMLEDVSPQNQDTSTIKLTPLSFNLLSNGVVRKYRVGEKVGCNDFNAFGTDNIHHNKADPRFWIDFMGSDCQNVVTNIPLYLATCKKDSTKNPFCKPNSGACSTIQKMPRTYHHMSIFGGVAK